MKSEKAGNYKLEKIGSSTYRYRKMIKGKIIRINFDHKPTEREVTLRLAECIQEEGGKADTLRHCITDHISSREDILDPNSKRTYNNFISVLSDKLLDKNIYEITQTDIQKEINRHAATHAPKTTRSLHGFLSSIFKVYRPQFVLRTSLPHPDKTPRFRPNNANIKVILKEVEGTEYSIPYQLGILGLRRGEICALTLNDLKENELTINKTVYFSKGNGWLIKNSPKTDESNRTILIPESLANEIRENGKIFDGDPKRLNKHLHRIQDKLEIPRFRFHDLRSYFASYASTLNIPEADVMKMGGWKSDFVFKRLYRESIEESYKESSKLISNSILNS